MYKNINIYNIILMMIILLFSTNFQAQESLSRNRKFVKKYSDTYNFLSDCFYYELVQSMPKSKSFYLNKFAKKKESSQNKYVFVNGNTGKYGVINGKGEIVEKPEFEFFNTNRLIDFYFAYKKHCWYLFNDSLDLISQCEYDDFYCNSDFSDVILAKKGDKWGLINSKNEIIIELKYDKLEFIDRGKLLQYIVNNKYGLISINGKKSYETDIPFYFSEDINVKDLNCKYIIVNDKTGLILNGDTLLIKPEYDRIYPINYTYREKVAPDQLAFIIVKNKKGGLFYNKNIVVEPGNLAKGNININKYIYIYKENGKMGLIRLKNNNLTKFDAKYDSLYYLIPKFGMHYIEKLPLAAEKDKKWGVIDNNDNEILNIEYDTISLLSLTLKKLKKNYCFLLGKEGKYGVKNENNDLIYDFSLTSVIPVDDYRFLGVKNGKYGLINTNGKLLYDFELDSIKNIEDIDNWRGLDYFFAAKNGKFGMLTKSGKKLFDFKLADIKEFNRDYFLCKIGTKYGIINKIGDIVLDFECEEIKQAGNGFFIAKKNGKYGLLNPDGKIVYDFELSEIKNLDYTSNYRIKKTNKYGLINGKGNLILDFQYDGIPKIIEGTNYRYLAIAVKNGKYGLVQLRYVHPNKIEDFKELRSVLKKKYPDYLAQIIMVNGKTEIPFEYDRITEIGYSKVLLEKGKFYFVYDIDKQKYIDAEKVKENSQTIILYGKKGKIILNKDKVKE